MIFVRSVLVWHFNFVYYYSTIQIFIYSNIQIFKWQGHLVWCRSGQCCGATINIQWCNRESPLKYKDVVRFSYLKKIDSALFFSIFGEVANLFQLMFIPINVQELKFCPLKCFFTLACCCWWRNILRVPKGYSALITSDHYAAPAHEPCHHYGYLPLSPLPSIKSRSSVRPS